MKILVTGSSGFIGQNLVAELKRKESMDVLECNRSTDEATLDRYCQEADFVFHLAGVNRPKEAAEFMEGNYGFTATLLATLKKHKNACPFMISSSTQAVLDNPYGLSKKAGEELLFKYAEETGAPVLIYRLPNVFGKWGKPNYNSVVATFCYNIARGLPIQVNDPKAEINLVYIDDVIHELVNVLEVKEYGKDHFYEVPVCYTVRLGQIVELIQEFKQSREDRHVPNTEDAFCKKLYSTYLSYLPQDEFSYPLKMNIDHRGSFTEFLKTPDRGQISINVSKPGIVKGNHWHHTKNEKFLVVSGTGVVRFRRVGTDEVIEYKVSGEKLEVIDIPVGYTHNIENLGSSDMVTVMWANEKFDPDQPDTYYVEV